MSIKTSLALALSLALQLPTVWAEEAKPADPPKTEAAKPAEPAKPVEKPADAKEAPKKADATEAQKAMEEARRQEQLMGKFQTMLEEGLKAENPTLKAAAEKLSKIMESPQPPTLDNLNAALAEFKAAKGTLSPEEGTSLEDISNLLRDILKQIASHAQNQEKAPPAADAMDSDEEEGEEDSKTKEPSKK